MPKGGVDDHLTVLIYDSRNSLVLPSWKLQRRDFKEGKIASISYMCSYLGINIES